jgi:hypothetical protein
MCNVGVSVALMAAAAAVAFMSGWRSAAPILQRRPDYRPRLRVIEGGRC